MFEVGERGFFELKTKKNEKAVIYTGEIVEKDGKKIKIHTVKNERVDLDVEEIRQFKQD